MPFRASFVAGQRRLFATIESRTNKNIGNYEKKSIKNQIRETEPFFEVPSKEKTDAGGALPAERRPLNYSDDTFLESLVLQKTEASKEKTGNAESGENSADGGNKASRSDLTSTVYDQDAFLESLIAGESQKAEKPHIENAGNRQNESFTADQVSPESFLNSLLAENK